ncbi:MAG: efflux RND transporter periplasmic adaptor subunit [Planctomycetes bacterium]|nr:efflux RND transporter periplasmic adaptor subunit [Planctomycetota bacterium]
MPRFTLSRYWNLLLLASVAAAPLLGPACSPPSAATPQQELAAPEPRSITVVGEKALLHLVHPHLVQGGTAGFLAHLTARESGEPIREGSVTLSLGSSSFTANTPQKDGLFVPTGALPSAGTFRAALTIRTPLINETLSLGDLVVHPSLKDAEAAARSSAQALQRDAVPFIMESQWKVKLLLAAAEKRTLADRLSVQACTVIPEDASVEVAAPATGLLVAPQPGRMVKTGEQVGAKQVLARVEPPLSTSEIAQIRSLEMEFDLRALEAARERRAAEARLKFAEIERERVVKLQPEGLSTKKQLEQAEQNLAVARSEHESAVRMSDLVERMIQQRMMGTGGRATAPVQIAVEAPFAGVVVDVHAVAGASIESGQPICKIVDPARLWVEAKVPELDLARAIAGSPAFATFIGAPGEKFQLAGVAGGLPYVSHEVEQSTRTVLYRYQLDNLQRRLQAGMVGEVQIVAGAREVAVAIPAEAVLREHGVASAYVMVDGELYQRRELVLGLSDGGWVEIIQGIRAGEYVASRGAHAVRLAALTPASFGEGHSH